jgi:hypothetical protein
MGIFIGSRPEKRHVAALLKCRQPENEALLSLFKIKLEETKASLVEADDLNRIHRLQGRAEVLRDFLEAVEQAPSVLERLK